MNAPSGVVTFLFTDIEGSTRRWESDAEAMRVALAVHDKVLRSTIRANGGFVFKHTGDGVCAAFDSPRAAVDAATDAQRELDLPVRMGIATGEAELRDGDYFGAVLNRRRAGDGCRPWRADPGGRLDGRSTQRRRLDGPRPTAVTRYLQPGQRFPAAGVRPTSGLSAPADSRHDTGNLRRAVSAARRPR